MSKLSARDANPPAMRKATMGTKHFPGTPKSTSGQGSLPSLYEVLWTWKKPVTCSLRHLSRFFLPSPRREVSTTNTTYYLLSHRPVRLLRYLSTKNVVVASLVATHLLLCNSNNHAPHNPCLPPTAASPVNCCCRLSAPKSLGAGCPSTPPKLRTRQRSSMPCPAPTMIPKTHTHSRPSRGPSGWHWASPDPSLQYVPTYSTSTYVAAHGSHGGRCSSRFVHRTRFASPRQTDRSLPHQPRTTTLSSCLQGCLLLLHCVSRQVLE